MISIRLIASFLLMIVITSTSISAYGAQRKIPNKPVVEHTFETSSGLPVKYYISTGKPTSPLVLFVQGSGCKPVMNGANAEGGSTVYDFLPTVYKSGFNAMVVDKPFTPEKDNGTGGASKSCSEEFNTAFSFESWFDVLDSAFGHAIKSNNAFNKNVLVLGVSEGAVMAAALANKYDEIRDVALVGASGENQLFDFISLAHTNGQHDRIEGIIEIAKEILRNPNSSEKFAWGHTYKRWSSFYNVSVSDFLEGKNKRVYLVSGTNDRSVPIQSTEILYSKLFLQGSDVTFRRVIGAGHNLLKDGDDWSKLDTEYRLIKDWYLGFKSSN